MLTTCFGIDISFGDDNFVTVMTIYEKKSNNLIYLYFVVTFNPEYKIRFLDKKFIKVSLLVAIFITLTNLCNENQCV